jgi:hypothetical protein
VSSRFAPLFLSFFMTVVCVGSILTLRYFPTLVDYIVYIGGGYFTTCDQILQLTSLDDSRLY